MKKSKKALLWTIVPVLGVSSGVAGAVAGVTNQKTSVDTNNVATPATATTMATRSTSNFKVTDQTREVLAYSGLSPTETLFVVVTGAPKYGILNYKWEVNKGNRWETHTSTNRSSISVDISDRFTTIQNWTFRCTISDTKSSAKVVSEDIKFTIVPREGRLIEVTQPIADKSVEGGEVVTLTTSAKGIKTYSDKEIGYQWFEYDSANDRFTKIVGATDSSYTFSAPYYTTQKTKKYVCRYYVKGQKSDAYLSESNQSIITIKKSAKEQVKFDKLKASSQSIKVGESVTLSVEATSTKSQDLKYQWYKLGADGVKFEKIIGADTKTYNYRAQAEDVDKDLTFMVMAAGIVQDDLQNYFQSNNLKVKVVAAEATGTSTNGTFTNKLNVTSSVVTTNQASVRPTFHPVRGINTPTYRVDVESAGELTYKWYYVGSRGEEHLIEGATSNVLTTSKSLYEKVYNDNINHKVGIMCKIFKGNELVGTVSQTTNRSFYMTVVIARR